MIPTPVSNIKNTFLSIIININNKKLKDAYAVLSANVVHEINKISYAEIVLIADNVELASRGLSDSEDLDPGNDIEIVCGYGDDDANTVFTGVIVKHGVDISSSAFKVKIICKHKAVCTTFNKSDAEFAQQTDSDIISNVISNYSGLSATVERTGPVQEHVFKRASTDWDFILSRAELFGYIVTQDGNGVYIGKPKLSAAPVLRVCWGESIISFNAEMNAEQQVPSLSVSGWDINMRALITETATEPTLNSQGNMSAKTFSAKLGQKSMSIVSAIPMASDELSARANGYLLRMRLNAIKGQVIFVGSGIVKTGDLIQLEGVGKKFDGNAFVSSVSHIIEDGAWQTKVGFGLDAHLIHEKSDFPYPDVLGQLPAIKGLHIAIVQKIFEDPQSQYRILVNIPSASETQTGFWARLCNLYATSGAGSFFFPEIGDEVIVGFLENDSRYPIILGAAYSSTLKPAVEPVDNNNYVKALVTKAQLKLGFDDEKKIITIQTPGGNVITLNDNGKSIEIKDMNKNSVMLSEAGIDLSSDKDISINGANINITAKQKISLSAKTDVTMESNNMKLTAKIGFAAKGTTAEVAGTGQTTIKGGMVMIN